MGFQLRILELEEEETITYVINNGRSQWLRGLWPGFAAGRFLGLRVFIPPGAWASVSCELCVFSRRVLCGRPRSPTECECVTECGQTYQLISKPTVSWKKDVRIRNRY
jgi:hypothetical protein